MAISILFNLLWQVCATFIHQCESQLVTKGCMEHGDNGERSLCTLLCMERNHWLSEFHPHHISVAGRYPPVVPTVRGVRLRSCEFMIPNQNTQAKAYLALNADTVRNCRKASNSRDDAVPIQVVFLQSVLCRVARCRDDGEHQATRQPGKNLLP